MKVSDFRPRHQLNTDILVIGGGAAGVAAAVTAARQGLHVTMIEKYGFCGGGAVAGLSGTICGMYEATENANPNPNQIVHGFLEEFVSLMEERNGLTGPVQYGKTHTRVHDPLVWRDVADFMVKAAGVQVLYHTVVTDVLMDGGEAIEGVIAYSKEGKVEIRAKRTIDASGDADVIAMAGLPYTMGNNGEVQNPTMIFRLSGVDVETVTGTYGPDSIVPYEVSEHIKKLHEGGDWYLPRAKIFLFETPRPGELICNATRIIGEDGRELNAVIRDDLTEAEFEGRRQVREYARYLKEHIKGCEDSWVNDTGVQVGVRQTRQVVGTETLTNGAVEGAVKRSDGIARSAWPVELHKGDKPRLVWVMNEYYEVPFGCFVPEKGENILAAGRCLSAEHEAMASARVTAQCFSYGHAVGHAATLSLREKIDIRDIKGEDVRDILNKDGAQLG